MSTTTAAYAAVTMAILSNNYAVADVSFSYGTHTHHHYHHDYNKNSHASATVAASNSFMDCGNGVELCGVLTLQTGLGAGNYNHPTPSVHGLWPQVGRFGNSECIPPEDPAPVTRASLCYAEEGNTWFQNHEWTKHGVCAGVKSATDFFAQVCDLAASALNVMEQARENGGDLDSISTALSDNGYPVYFNDTRNSQVELSACAGANRVWKLAKVSDFSTVCESVE